MKISPILAALLAAAALPSIAQAQDAGSLRRIVGFDITTGGKTLATAFYSDGSSQSIKSGGLLQILGGVEYRAPSSPMTIQGTIGYHYQTTAADNGSITFSRFPIEAVALFNANDQFRFGAGLRYTFNATLKSSGAASGVGNYDFENSAGLLVKGEWMVSPAIGIEARIVSEKYKVKGGSSVDGGHFGLGANFYF